MAGRVFISPLIEYPWPEAFCTLATPPQPAPAEELTRREYEIIQCLADGKTVAQMAGELCISIYTIYTHITNIKRKLNLRNQKELIRYAVEHAISRGDAGQSIPGEKTGS